jgi:hypothetical protein
MASGLIDLVNKLRGKGINGVFKAVFAKIYARAYLYKLTLPTPLNFPESKLKLEPLTLNRLEGVYQMYPSEISKSQYELLKKRLENASTEKTYIIVDDLNQVYGYYHIAIADCLETGTNYHVKVEPQTIYLFDDYTFVRWRGLGAHKVSILARLRIAWEQGCTSATVIIMKRNRHSEQAYQKIGFTKFKEITFYNMVLFRRTVVKDVE